MLKTWNPEAQEIWLTHVNRTREQFCKGDLGPEDKCNQEDHSDVCSERSNKLRKTSTTQFHDWRMKHHNNTLSQYLHSQAELNRQFKRRKLANL